MKQRVVKLSKKISKKKKTAKKRKRTTKKTTKKKRKSSTRAPKLSPKVEACMTALDAGVSKAHIIDGRISHSLLLEIYTDKGIGTQIVKN